MGASGVKGGGGVCCPGADCTLKGAVGVVERRSASAVLVGTASCTAPDVSDGAVDEGTWAAFGVSGKSKGTCAAFGVSGKSRGVAEVSGLGERAGGAESSRVLTEEGVILSGTGREGTVARCGTVFF
jgi:hypothetical protein